MKKVVPLLLLLCLVILTLPAQATQKPLAPVGKITFDATAVGLGATISWGRGWLTFKGKSYPIRVDGLGLVGVGLSHVRAHGKVYNLKNAKDIAGNYGEASAGIAIIGGVKGFLVKNKEGVVIELFAEQTGVNFNLGGGTFTITMAKP